MRFVPILLLSVLGACQSTSIALQPLPDTVIGIVRVVGANPFAYPILQLADGTSITLMGASPAAFSALDGIEIRASGVFRTDSQTPTTSRIFEIRAFEALRMGNRPLIDGIIEVDGHEVWIVDLRGQRVALPRAYDLFAPLAGARVWIQRNPEGDVELFDIIDRPHPPRNPPDSPG